MFIFLCKYKECHEVNSGDECSVKDNSEIMLAEKMKCGSKRKKADWAWPGIEPGTSRNSEDNPKRESCH
ncbi:unnamed protein product [Rhizophagus irregularis]|uniref:Uncharacterized protein n=1 Tax=Rhizophagus irregularis TaxID=588596 RepID=A0A915YP14_9GLOM|nr:unnamed protein product [Rhizophagus irregularis]CAB4482235.1 unnamed protein product [Rhizophagus irregularis]CAB5184480.1 unnamed protein product [Rhizophagus irregularis]CAB5298991.1 unnamed protein product [Rhizophagus irregularis]